MSKVPILSSRSLQYWLPTKISKRSGFYRQIEILSRIFTQFCAKFSAGVAVYHRYTKQSVLERFQRFGHAARRDGVIYLILLFKKNIGVDLIARKVHERELVIRDTHVRLWCVPCFCAHLLFCCCVLRYLGVISSRSLAFSTFGCWISLSRIISLSLSLSLCLLSHSLSSLSLSLSVSLSLSHTHTHTRVLRFLYTIHKNERL